MPRWCTKPLIKSECQSPWEPRASHRLITDHSVTHKTMQCLLSRELSLFSITLILSRVKNIYLEFAPCLTVLIRHGLEPQMRGIFCCNTLAQVIEGLCFSFLHPVTEQAVVSLPLRTQSAGSPIQVQASRGQTTLSVSGLTTAVTVLKPQTASPGSPAHNPTSPAVRQGVTSQNIIKQVNRKLVQFIRRHLRIYM